MGRVLLFLLGLVFLVIAAAIAIPFFIPTDTYRAPITRAVEDATGREFRIDGDMELSLFPPLSFRISDVSLGNAPGAAEPVMAQMKELTVGVEVLPILFSQQVKVTRFVLTEPVINLEVDASGKPNWEFEGATGGGQETQASTPAPDGQSGGGVNVQDITLENVRLVDGTINYLDRRTGERVSAEEINASIGLPSLDGPLSADGRMTYNNETLRLDTEIANPRAFMEERSTNVALDLSSTLINMTFAGSAALIDAPQMTLPLEGSGTLDLDVPSVRALSAWAGSPIDGEEGFGPLKIQGQAAAQGDRLSFNDATLSFDEMSGDGNLTVDLDRPRPFMSGAVTLDQIDTRPYEPAPAEGGGSGGSGGGGSAPANQDWSDEPIDFSGLKAVDMDFQITVDRFITSSLQMGRSALAMTLDNGLFTADLKELALYEGSGQIFLQLDARQPNNAIVQNRMRFNVIQALPLLKDMIGAGLLQGVGNMELDLTTRGRSQRDFVSALNGTGNLLFNDGALFGINLAQLVRRPADTIAQLTLNMSRSGLENSAEKTDFAEMGATFAIRNGLFQTDDFRLLNPLVRLLGAGNTNLLTRTVDFRLDPRAVGSLQGQGGEAQVNGIGVPVRVTGTWDNLRFAPDLEGIGRSLIDRELGEGTSDILDDPGKAIQEGIGGLLRGDQDKEDGDKKDGEEKEDNPVDRIQSLFGRSDDDKDKDKKDKDKKDKDKKNKDKKDKDKKDKDKKKKKDDEDGGDGGGAQP